MRLLSYSSVPVIFPGCSDKGSQKNSSHRSVRPRHYCLGKAFLAFFFFLISFIPVSQNAFLSPPCCLSSLLLSLFPVYSWQSDLADAVWRCLLWSLTQRAFANRFQLPDKEQLMCCFQTPLLPFTVCFHVLKRGPLLRPERKGGLDTQSVQSSADLWMPRWTQSRTLLEKFLKL